MIVDTPRHLVPIGDLDPVRAASLTDAALTPYQAIKSVLPRLVGVDHRGHRRWWARTRRHPAAP